MATQADQQTDRTHKGDLAFEEQGVELSDNSTQHTGYDCEFVEHPQDIDAYCPICLSLLCEPQQVTCCGKRYCRPCIKRVELQKKPCPTCNEQNFSFFADKRHKQVLYAICVHCSHKKEGCQWMGELGELDKHLNESPILGQQFIGCEFAEVECKDCSKSFQRQHFKAHQLELHPFSCEYCHNYESYYEDVVKNHWPVCGSYPVPCPNECGVYPERHNLEYHVNNDCSLTVVDCEYCSVGCKVQLSRKDMSVHLAQDVADHIALVATHSQREIKQKDEQIAELKKEAQTKYQQLRADFTHVLRIQQQLQETQDRILRETEEGMTRQLRDAEERTTRQLRETKEGMTRQLRETEEGMTSQLQDAEVRIARQCRGSERRYFGITVCLLVVMAAIMVRGGYVLHQESEDLKNRIRNLIREINQSEVTSKKAMAKMEQEVDSLKKKQKVRWWPWRSRL